MSGRTPSQARIAKLATAFIEGIGKLDGHATFSMMSEDAQFLTQLRSTSLPLKPEISAREYCFELMPIMADLFPSGVPHRVTSTLVEGSIAIVESIGEGISKTGEVYSNKYCFILTFSGHIIIEVKEYADFLHVKEVVFN